MHVGCAHLHIWLGKHELQKDTYLVWKSEEMFQQGLHKIIAISLIKIKTIFID